MTCKPFVRRLSLGAVLLACAAIAAPAFAQGSGSIKGKIIGTDGKPAASAEVLFVDTKDATKGPFLGSAGADGAFTQTVPAGSWNLTIKQGKGYAEKKDAVEVKAGDTADAGEIRLRPASAAEATKFDETTKALIAKHNEKVAKQQAAVTAADAAAKAGNFDDAITKYGEVADVVENCGLCYVRIGDLYRDNKNDMDGAEKSYKKALELADASGDNTAKAGAYNGLAAVYNKQKKFDEASTMSAKAADLSTTDAAGGGDATALYNAGISLWNAAKYPEAQAQFQKAVKIDPKMAEAFYYLAMTEVNQNKLADAKPNLETYLKLAPDGPNAATAKAVLESIK
jgi:tetratricopeptide (TPR) repeat protein